MDDLLITLSESATSKIRAFQEAEDRQGMALRVAVREDGPAAFRYELQFVSAESRTLSDAALEVEGILIYVDEESVPNLKGTLLDYVETLDSGGFAFDNPNQPPLLRDPVAARVHQLIQEQIKGSHLTADARLFSTSETERSTWSSAADATAAEWWR